MRISLRQRQTFDTFPGLVAASTPSVLVVDNPPRIHNHRLGRLTAAIAVGVLTSLGAVLPAAPSFAQDTPEPTTYVDPSDSVEGMTTRPVTLRLTNQQGEIAADQKAIDDFAESLSDERVTSITVEGMASGKWGPLETSLVEPDEGNRRIAIYRTHETSEALKRTGITEGVPTFLTAREVMTPQSTVDSLKIVAQKNGFGTIDQMWNDYQAANEASARDTTGAEGTNGIPLEANSYFVNYINGAQGATITANVVDENAGIIPSREGSSRSQATVNAEQAGNSGATPTTIPPTPERSAAQQSTSGNGEGNYHGWGLAAVSALALVGASRLKAVRKATNKAFRTVKANIPSSTGRFAWTQDEKYNEFLKDSSFERIDKITYGINERTTTDLRIAYVKHNVNDDQAIRVQNLITQAVKNNPSLLKKIGLVAVFNAPGNESINTSRKSVGVLEINVNPLSDQDAFDKVSSEILVALAPSKFERSNTEVEVNFVELDCKDARITRYQNEAKGISPKPVTPDLALYPGGLPPMPDDSDENIAPVQTPEAQTETETEVTAEPQRINRVPYVRPPDVISGYPTEETGTGAEPEWPVGRGGYGFAPTQDELDLAGRFLDVMQDQDLGRWATK